MDEVARAMQRGHRLACPRATPNPRGPVGGMTHDPRLRGMQVEHPLFDRALEHELEVARAELGNGVRGLGVRQALGEFMRVDASVVSCRWTSAVVDREVALLVVPHV